MKNKEVYKVTISKVKSLSGLTLEKVTKEFKTEDNETPKVENLIVTGPKNFQIVFSEPIKTAGTVKLRLDGKTAAGVSVKKSDTSERIFDATVASNLQDGKTYTVLVTGFEDYAKYKNIDTELELEYAKVTEAPTVEVVKATQEYVEFKFNRPVKGLKLENFYHTYSAWKPVASYNSVEEMDKDLSKKMDVLKPTEARDKVVVRFIHTVDEFVNKANNNLHPLQVGDVEVNVLGQVGSRKVVDNWGNQLQDTELMVSISADKEAPVVESVEVVGEKEIEVTFSKKVLENRSNYEILNESGGKISGLAFTTSKEGKKVKINVGSPNLVGKTVILNVKDVKDDTINMNKMVGVESFNLTFGDKTFKGIKEAVLKVSNVPGQDYYANPTLYVAFSEAVDPESAMNIKNYLFTKDITLEESKKSFFGVDADTSMFSDTVVQLVMSRETFEKKFGTAATFQSVGGLFPAQVYISSNLKDLAGNSYNAFAKFVQIKDASTAPQITDNEVKVTGYRTVEFSYDLPVMTKSYEIAKSQFLVGIDNGADGILFDAQGKLVDKNDVVLAIDSVEFNGSKGVKIQLEDKKYNDFRESADAKKVVVTYTASADKDKRITNELGTDAANFVATATGAPKIVDNLAPAFVQKHVNTVDNIDFVEYQYVNGYNHKVLAHFNEAMDDQTFSIHTFKVTGKDGTEYKPQAWDLSADKKTLELNFRTTSKASIDTLAQELGSSIGDSAAVVDVVENNITTKYYTYFNIQLQEFNSARDLAKNGFGSNSVYPVYHTKAEAVEFINAAKNLDGLETSDLINLKLMHGDKDVTGGSVEEEASKLAAPGVTLKAEHNDLDNKTYEWKVDDVVQAGETTATFVIKKAGKVTVTVSTTKDGKTVKESATVTVSAQLDKLEPKLTTPAGTATDATVGQVELEANLMKDAVNNDAVYFINNAPAFDQNTFGVVIIAAPGATPYANAALKFVAKAGDKITLVEYNATPATGKVVATGSVVVEDAKVIKWGGITTSTYLAVAPKAGFNKIALTGLLVGDTVELFKNGVTFGKLENITSATPSYELATGQSIVAGDKFTLKITRNGQVSEMSGGDVVAVPDSTTVTGDATGIQITEATGAVVASGAGDDGFIKLTLSEGTFIKDVQVSQFEIVEFKIVPDSETSPAGYELQIDSVDRKPGEEGSVLLKVSKKGAGTMTIPTAATHYAFKIKVSGSARDGATADLTTASFQAATN